MKRFKYIILLLLIMAGTTMAESDQSPENIIQLLNDNSSIKDRLLGFSYASKNDSKEVNDKLVELLDSKKEGGKLHSLRLLPSWHGALIILAERFPEAGINGEPLAYEQQNEAIDFKNWWAKNASRIMYHDSTHTLTADAQFDTNESTTQTIPPPKLTPQLSPASDTTTSLQSSALKNTPIPPNQKTSSSSLWLYFLALISVFISTVWFSLRRRSKK